MASARSKLKRAIDTVFSQYIRKRDANFNGWVECCTCGKPEHWEDVDAGHFQLRDRMATRYDEQNVHAQCRRCNRFRDGEQFIMGQYIDQKYGEGVADRLRQKANKGAKLSMQDLQEIKTHFQKLLKTV